MKKILAAIVLLVYFTVSTGFVICVHYCMDRFDSVQLGNDKTALCNKCGMHKSEGCCRDKVVVVKLQLDHLAAPDISSDFTQPAIVLHTGNYTISPLCNFLQINYSVAHSPPLNEQDTYLYNRVFRI